MRALPASIASICGVPSRRLVAMERPRTRYGIAAVLRVEQGNYIGNADDVRLPVP